MGGASGHLSHLVEDWDLTFDDLKDVVTSIAEARLEGVSEKTDGVNLVFTWNEKAGGVRAARNSSDIKGGGMDAPALARRFSGRGVIEAALTGAFAALERGLRAMPADARIDIFGPAGDRWYSIEVMYAEAPNTIRYDGNNVVFHREPVFVVDPATGRPIKEEGLGGTRLARWIDTMRAGTRETGWTLHPWAAVELHRLVDGTVMAQALSGLDAAMAQVRLDDGATIGEYVHRRIESILDEESNMTLPDALHAALAARIAGVPGAPTLTAIKKMAPDMYATSKALVDDERRLVEQALAPLERTMRQFAVGVLRGVSSLFVSDPSAEAARLRAATAKAMTALGRSRAPQAKAILAAVQDKLTRLDDISPIEGIVFMHKGRPYKLTGAFAPMNRILGFFTHEGGAGLVEARRRLMAEGGHSFSDVGPVTRAGLQAAWPEIEGLLVRAGALKITPIGTTWKKDPMGDVDLAMEHAGGREGLYAALVAARPGIELRRVGSNIVSIAFPLESGAVQVDAMVGDVGLLGWTRYGPSPVKGHPEYSTVKGVVRNMLLDVIARHASGRAFPGKQGELDRERYVVDSDRGLHRVVQARRPNKQGGHTAWRTVERELVTDRPDELVSVLLGPGHRAQALRRFEELAAALRRSETFASELDQMAEELVEKLRERVKERGPDALGAPLERLEAFVRRELSSA